jgi:hypothetical protein
VLPVPRARDRHRTAHEYAEEKKKRCPERGRRNAESLVLRLNLGAALATFPLPIDFAAALWTAQLTTSLDQGGTRADHENLKRERIAGKLSKITIFTDLATATVTVI